jgi:hypothetical protein
MRTEEFCIDGKVVLNHAQRNTLWVKFSDSFALSPLLFTAASGWLMRRL